MWRREFGKDSRALCRGGDRQHLVRKLGTSSCPWRWHDLSRFPRSFVRSPSSPSTCSIPSVASVFPLVSLSVRGIYFRPHSTRSLLASLLLVLIGRTSGHSYARTHILIIFSSYHPSHLISSQPLITQKPSSTSRFDTHLRLRHVARRTTVLPFVCSPSFRLSSLLCHMLFWV